jgi:type IV pilus assembly protein PilA
MKKSNKGFSLVELIIVIAIMAVLIAVLAPQYLKYVEKSRKTADATTWGELVKAMDTCLADPDFDTPTGNTVTVSMAGTGAVTIGGLGTTAVADYKSTASIPSSGSVKIKSKAFKAATCLCTWTYNSTNSTWTKAETGVPS